jgi:L-lysine exporter family protein LysE/ArgO
VLTAAVAGLVTGLGLIVAIGAQNAFVLRQGLLRAHVVPVVAVCALSDVVLILAGVGGIGVLIERAGWLIFVARWFGAAFLVWYGVCSLRQALGSKALDAAIGRPVPGARGGAVGRAVALTWLNPHVYLDTVFLLGSVAATHGAGGRWWFALGACLGSVLWFSGLGFGARRAAPVVSRPWAWRAIDLLTGVTMLVVAASLLLP